MKKIKSGKSFGVRDFSCDRCGVVFVSDEYKYYKDKKNIQHIKNKWYDRHVQDILVSKGYTIYSSCPQCGSGATLFVSDGSPSWIETIDVGA